MIRRRTIERGNRFVVVATSVAGICLPMRAVCAQTTNDANPMVVSIEQLPEGLRRAQVRRAIAEELHVRVVGDRAANETPHSTLTVSFDYDGNLHETFRDASGREIDRTVASPRSSRELLHTIAWLAGNLARHEADDVLAGLPSTSITTTAVESASSAPLPAAPATSLAPAETPVHEATRASASPSPPPASRTISLAPPRSEGFRVLLSFFPPVSTDGAAIGTRSHSIGIAALGSSGRRLTGFDLASAFTFTHDDAFGMQIAGLANVVGCRVRGVQFAAMANVSGCDAQGLQLAAMNIVRGDTLGVQLAGIVNATGHNAFGLQLGALNLVGGTATGLQWGGIANAARDLDGWQLGSVNIARARARGAQFGFYQHASTMYGVQVGAVNYAGELHGVQLGLVNIAGRGTGASIGVVTIAPGEPAHIEVTGGTVPALGIALRHGTRYVRNVYSFSVAPFSQQVAWMPGWGIGVHIPGARVEFDVDVLAHWIQRGASFSLQPNILTQLRAASTIVIAPRFGVMLGAALNWMYTVDAANADLVIGPRATVAATTGATQQQFVWPSVLVGLRL